nr:MAG TPA: hypothetical protein [Caudoviricetes sp.]
MKQIRISDIQTLSHIQYVKERCILLPLHESNVQQSLTGIDRKR